MKTAVAHALKSMSVKIHPPLPTTPRDSQRLLSLLNDSFKQQLDAEHSASSPCNEHLTNLHLQSILKDPLFDPKPQTRAIPIYKSHPIVQHLGQAQDLAKYPMDAFKERVSRGTADLESAKFCLRAQYKACLISPAATPREAMQSSRAASMILQWLWSSGMEDTGTFLKDLRFLADLMPFLIAEDQHSRVSHWLIRCQNLGQISFSSLHGFDTIPAQRTLFLGLMREELRIGNGLESAINLFVRTVASLRTSGLSCVSVQSAGALQAAWLLTKATIRLPKKVAVPEPSIIHAFLSTMRKLNRDHLLTAYLSVYIQKRPDPHPALLLFQSTSFRSSLYRNMSRRSHTVQLGLSAATLFLQDGHETEALWIMEFLQNNFAEEVGAPLPPVVRKYHVDPNDKKVRKEEESLHLLDRLAIQ